MGVNLVLSAWNLSQELIHLLVRHGSRHWIDHPMQLKIATSEWFSPPLSRNPSSNFSTYGLPEMIVFSNGTKFSASLDKFCRSPNICHFCFPPYPPMSTVKRSYLMRLKMTFFKSLGDSAIFSVHLPHKSAFSPVNLGSVQCTYRAKTPSNPQLFLSGNWLR